MEKRIYNVQLRADQQSRMVEGYAVVFDSFSKDLGGFKEIISADAFDETDMSDTKALFNHNYDFPLASIDSNSLVLDVDEKGIRYTFEMPNTTYGNDLLELMSRGIIYQSSFAFTVDSGNTRFYKDDDGKTIRSINKIEKLYDVSIVTEPAYEDTSVAIKRYNQYIQEQEEQQKPVKKADWIDSYLTILNLGNNDN